MLTYHLILPSNPVNPILRFFSDYQAVLTQRKVRVWQKCGKRYFITTFSRPFHGAKIQLFSDNTNVLGTYFEVDTNLEHKSSIL